MRPGQFMSPSSNAACGSAHGASCILAHCVTGYWILLLALPYVSAQLLFGVRDKDPASALALLDEPQILQRLRAPVAKRALRSTASGLFSAPGIGLCRGPHATPSAAAFNHNQTRGFAAYGAGRSGKTWTIDVNATVPPATPVEEEVYLCGARTKKDTPCSRRVHGPKRCWQHKGMKAMLTQEKLLIKDENP